MQAESNIVLSPLRAHQYTFDLVYVRLRHRLIDKRRMKIASIHRMSLVWFFDDKTTTILTNVIVRNTTSSVAHPNWL